MADRKSNGASARMKARTSSAARKPPVGKAAATVAAQQARVKGYALDLSMGGPDAVDDDFRESA